MLRNMVFCHDVFKHRSTASAEFHVKQNFRLYTIDRIMHVDMVIPTYCSKLRQLHPSYDRYCIIIGMNLHMVIHDAQRITTWHEYDQIVMHGIVILNYVNTVRDLSLMPNRKQSFQSALRKIWKLLNSFYD